MSESRNEGTRSYGYGSSYSSESRDSGESRSSYLIYPGSIYQRRIQYNEIEEIDRLIERLERTNIPELSKNTRYNDAYEKRKQQLEQLKRLREEALEKIEEDRRIRQIEQENAEIDSAIRGVKILLRKSTPQSRNYDYSYDSSESRDSGESRW